MDGRKAGVVTVAGVRLARRRRPAPGRTPSSPDKTRTGRNSAERPNLLDPMSYLSNEWRLTALSTPVALTPQT